jgi:hypothetical protein
MNKFLETLASDGENYLLAINTIHYIRRTNRASGWQIQIICKNANWIELFENEEKCNVRYEEIKKIVSGK